MSLRQLNSKIKNLKIKMYNKVNIKTIKISKNTIIIIIVNKKIFRSTLLAPLEVVAILVADLGLMPQNPWTLRSQIFKSLIKKILAKLPTSFLKTPLFSTRPRHLNTHPFHVIFVTLKTLGLPLTFNTFKVASPWLLKVPFKPQTCHFLLSQLPFKTSINTPRLPQYLNFLPLSSPL